MGMLPIFAIEEGRLTPMEKVRTQRHLFESFLEFINEFEAPAHIALMRGASHNTIRDATCASVCPGDFPETPFSEHAIAPHLACIIRSAKYRVGHHGKAGVEVVMKIGFVTDSTADIPADLARTAWHRNCSGAGKH